MKRTISVLFLSLFLFFIIGYKAVFSFLKYNSEVKLEQRLDNENYANSETINLKIPLTLPYQINNQGYEKGFGKFEHEGEFYHIVKQKLENDTLYIVCIKNDSKKMIVEKMEDFEKSVHNFPSSSKNTSLLNLFIKDYIVNDAIQFVSTTGWNKKIKFFHSSSKEIDHHFSIIAPPPEV